MYVDDFHVFNENAMNCLLSFVLFVIWCFAINSGRLQLYAKHPLIFDIRGSLAGKSIIYIIVLHFQDQFIYVYECLRHFITKESDSGDAVSASKAMLCF